MFKKPFLLLISVLLIVAMAFMAFMPVFAVDGGDGHFGKIEVGPELKETNRAIYYSFLSGRLTSSFPTVLIQDELGEREIVVYPTEYAGAYIDKSGTLHIVLTKNADYIATKHNYQEIMGNDEEIVYDVADFSLFYLYEVQSTLGKVMIEFNVSVIAANEITNSVDVYVDGTKEMGVLEFLKTKFDNFDERCITFCGPTEFRFTVADSTGNALTGSYTSTNTQFATLGFNAYRHDPGHAGVVTAGHYATIGTSIKNAKGTTIGSATVSQSNGTIDAAFIPFPSGITRSYRISTAKSGWSSPNDFMTHYYPTSADYAIGTPVHKIGSNTSLTTGTIQNKNAYGAYNGVTITDLVVVSNTQLQGDSGGPVVTTVTASPVTFHSLVGIATFSDSNNNGYVSKVHNIMNAFGITPDYGEV